jgi:hypothetical protein
VFRRNEQHGLGFYTAQSTRYIPLKAKLELNVGTDDQVVYERDVNRVKRPVSSFTFDRHGNVTGYDEQRTWREEIRNYRDRTIRMEVRHQLSGDVDFLMSGSPGLFDNSTVEYTVDVPAGKQQRLFSRGTFHMGKNQRRIGITLEELPEGSSLESLRDSD